MTHALVNPVGDMRGQRNANDDAIAHAMLVDLKHVAGAIDQPLRERETNREIRQIARRGHQHGVPDSVELKCDRRLDRDLAFDPALAVVPPHALQRVARGASLNVVAQAVILTGTDLAAGTWLSSA